MLPLYDMVSATFVRSVFSQGMIWVCVRSFFLPIGIQHNSVRADSSILEKRAERDTSSVVKKIQNYAPEVPLLLQ